VSIGKGRLTSTHVAAQGRRTSKANGAIGLGVAAHAIYRIWDDVWDVDVAVISKSDGLFGSNGGRPIDELDEALFLEGGRGAGVVACLLDLRGCGRTSLSRLAPEEGFGV